MKAPDLDKERSERKLSLGEFLTAYNRGLPKAFPRASAVFLNRFQEAYPSQFKDGMWSLDLHRKKFMDWLPQYLRSLS